jgi:hypothetical protein
MTTHTIGSAAALALILTLTTAHSSAPAQAQPLAVGKVMTIPMTTAARVFDMDPTGTVSPPGWMTPGFDGSVWDHATTQRCVTRSPFHSPVPQPWVTSSRPSVNSGPVWGPIQGHSYLLRQTFMVPKAQSYYDSVLAFTLTVSPSPDLVLINGTLIYEGDGHSDQIAIEPYLHPGLNVLTAELGPSATSCNSFNDAITLRMTGLQRPNPLVLSWRKVPGATCYDLQVWLVKAAPGQTITPDSEVNVATQTTGPHATLDDATMPAGIYQWRTAAVNAQDSLMSGWTPVQTVTLK